MTTTLRAYLGNAGLLDIGYRFFTQNTPASARVTADILDEGGGWYSADAVTLAGDHVRWDSLATMDAVAREDLGQRMLLEFVVGKLTVGEPEEPVIVIPSAPADVSLCRVFGFFETLDNLPVAGLNLTFELIVDGPVASERLISGRKVTATTDALGRLVNSVGSLYLELQRTDRLTPTGLKYAVTCPELELCKKLITLEDETVDLLTALSLN